MSLPGDWSIWDWVCLRAPGFPADHVLRLAAPDAVAATDRLGAETDALEAARARAIAVLERAPASKPVNRALKALKRGEAPGPIENLDDASPVLDAVARAHAAHAQAQATATALLDEAARKVAQVLHETASEPRFREALLWQNRMAVHASIASLLRRPLDANDSKTREHRRLVASCMQRYSVKNDTIGFFGPVGWARFTAGAEAVTARPGAKLLTGRHVYFEYWCIDALAQKLAQDPAQRPFMRPRRSPSVWLDGALLHHPNGRRIELPAAFAALLCAIDGERSARELAHALLADPSLGIDDEAEVFELLAELERKGLCSWTFEIPTATFHPEQHLRELLARAEGAPRERGLAALAQLEERRAAVARAAGDPDRLDQALGELEATFVQLTEASATRKGGETYAGRTLLFEDCTRDLGVELGSEILDRLGPPLALVLQSARWYTHTIAARYEVALRGVYDELRAADPGAPVEYVRFQQQMSPLFPGPQADHGIAHDVAQALQTSWDAILGIGDGEAKQLQRSSDEVRAAVDAAFRAPCPGWPGARHHSPDVLIAAESLEAIRRGAYRIVLGELHVGFNTVTLPCLLKEHPEPALLVRAREVDLPEPAVAPVWSKARNRADFFSVSRNDYDLEAGETRSARARSQVLASGSLVIDDVDGQLMVRPRGGGPSFHLMAFLEQHLIAESFSRFRLLSRRRHTPRITLDHVIVQRETWHLNAGVADFAGETTELGRFLAARRFAARHGMPRMVYAKTDSEAKPFFVDFESPILIEILARQLKRSRHVVLSEMSPGVAECWLPDADGHRYTSELRIVATDPQPWRPSPRRA